MSKCLTKYLQIDSRSFCDPKFLNTRSLHISIKLHRDKKKEKKENLFFKRKKKKIIFPLQYAKLGRLSASILSTPIHRCR